MTPSIRCRTESRLRRGAAFAAALMVGALLAGCVSAVENTTAFGYGGTGQPTASQDQKADGSAASAPADTERRSGSVDEESAEAGSSGTEKTDRAALASAPAPKESAGQAVADEARFGGSATADRDVPAATGAAAIAAFAGASVRPSSQTDQGGSAGAAPKADSTLFASLYAQSKAKTPIRNADVGKTRRVILPRQGSPIDVGDGFALPGVRAASSLFEIGQKASADYDADIIDEANGEEGTYQTASISGLARLAPNGLMVQRPDVQTSCFAPDLVSMIHAIETRFHTKIVVTSGYRSPSHNVRVNGAKRSMHLQCKAADIIVPGADKFQVANFVRTLPNRGGVGTYCHTAAIHIDTGRQRDWNWACRRSPSNDNSVLLASQKLSPRSSDD